MVKKSAGCSEPSNTQPARKNKQKLLLRTKPVPVMQREPVAVIDIGTSSIRMIIGEVDKNGHIRIIESLKQEVSLGRDTFSKGFIDRATINQCIETLRSFKVILEEYGIGLDRKRLRAVATSAVREASNRQNFLDRVYIATGIDIEPLDESEVNRLNYLSLISSFRTEPLLRDSTTFVIEVGAGSTEFLVIRSQMVIHSQTYRFGSMRMRELLEQAGAGGMTFKEAFDNELTRIMDNIKRKINLKEKLNLLLIGSVAVFAAEKLVREWDRSRLARFPVKKISELIEEVGSQTVDELVREFGLTYPEAETLTLSLIAYERIAVTFRLREVFVSSISMKDGILAELAGGKAWLAESREHIMNSVMMLGKKYEIDQLHAEQVTKFSLKLFQKLSSLHGLGPRHETLLAVAAYLHDVGLFINDSGHHKHSMYLILHSSIFGLSSKETLMVSLIARYHRKGLPSMLHEGYNSLTRDERIIVSKLASILRIADALARSSRTKIKNFDTEITSDELRLIVKNVKDITLESIAVSDKGEMFEKVYGLKVTLKKALTVETQE